MIGSVTKNGGRREMETNDRVCDQNGREEKWKLMIRSVTKNGDGNLHKNGKREEKWKLMIGSVTKNGARREMETYDRICHQKRNEKRNGSL